MPGLLRGVARTAVIAGTATSVSNRVSRRQAGRWAEQDQQAYEQQARHRPPPAGTPSRGQQVGPAEGARQLKEQGILSDAEFEREKARILG